MRMFLVICLVSCYSHQTRQKINASGKARQVNHNQNFQEARSVMVEYLKTMDPAIQPQEQSGAWVVGVRGRAPGTGCGCRRAGPGVGG